MHSYNSNYVAKTRGSPEHAFSIVMLVSNRNWYHWEGLKILKFFMQEALLLNFKMQQVSCKMNHGRGFYAI